MNKFRLTIKLIAIATFMFAFASIAQAQATRTWVSGVGDDANPCSRTAPCKTFAGAISKTAPAGEISVLDPGGFGAINITKSITINGEGTLAGILNAFVNGVTVNGALTDNITLRNISINAPNNGTNGIRIIGGKNVVIENVTINGVTGSGIEILDDNNINVMVNNVQIKNCTTAGIRADTSAGAARVTVKNSTITNSGIGIVARRNSRVSVIDSTISFNSVGVHVEGNGATAVAVLRNCQITNNTSHGVQAGGGASSTTSVARITSNIINNNAGSGISIQASGSVETFVNNEITGNNPDGCVGCINISGNIQ